MGGSFTGPRRRTPAPKRSPKKNRPASDEAGRQKPSAHFAVAKATLVTPASLQIFKNVNDILVSARFIAANDDRLIGTQLHKTL